MADPPARAEIPLRGIALFIAAFACFSCSDAASKLLTQTLPAMEVAWLRFGVFVLVMVAVAAGTGSSRQAFRSRRPGLQIIRALGVFGSTAFFILGLRYLPMAEATAREVVVADLGHQGGAKGLPLVGAAG